MEDDNSKVFSSSIIRTSRRNLNNYKDLLQVEPAKPVVTNSICVKTCNYVPKNDKFYIPKKKNGAKVKTVRDIRLILEKDVYSYLINDIEVKRNYLLGKIKLGCLKDPKLLSTAQKMLSNDSPMSRTVWRMLMNINPDGKIYPTQFVLWNGKNIKINGSKGGNNKYIFDVSNPKKSNTPRNRDSSGVNCLSQKKALLHNSLHVKFKPGPLAKKKFLDTSYQKHNFGNLELVRLPRPGLEVQPTYGKFIPPVISAFLYESFADNSNVLSENWANFAVSVLGSSINGCAIQSKEDCNKTYSLNYKCSQNRLLMRRDNEKSDGKILPPLEIKTNQAPDDLNNIEVQNVLNDIIRAVEIGLEQDKMYSGEDEVRESPNKENSGLNFQPKDSKTKKRTICELDRLDVTVIRIPKNIEKNPKTCTNSYCNLGCICDSLSCNYNIKGHCGRIQCMFKCTCDFSGYHVGEFLERVNYASYLPEIVSKDKISDLKLAKEEKKFHQTVIVTEDKSIVLKSRKRNCKISKIYASYYNNMRLKSEKRMEKELCVMVNKLDCTNIEPFCLVHNLYRCFCEGKFINTALEYVEEKNSSRVETETLSSDEPKTINDDSNSNTIEKSQLNQERSIRSLRIKSRLAAQITPDKTNSRKTSISSPVCDELIPFEPCARTEAYCGRKYSDGYYLATNLKIKEMEKNDVKLQKKLNAIIFHKKGGVVEENNETNLLKINKNKDAVSLIDKNVTLEENVTELDISCDSVSVEADTYTDISISLQNNFSNKSKLISWLETSYKQYKRKAEFGKNNLCLGPPQPGKMALYPWDFILSRYRERKNYFLITATKPYRLFMTVNENNKFFAKSYNINNIPWSEIDKYPITVKNLLTNATDIRDNFFILFGLTHSWELIGSVTKVSESIASANVNLTNNQNDESNNVGLLMDNIFKSGKLTPSKMTSEENSLSDDSLNDRNSDYSKWFVMTIENDFSELQFFKKGFFVKYESVMKAINVSRASKKTVRLSYQKCNSQQSDPQFGIYAIPNENAYCVFIGPYDKDENLGIETVNTTTDFKRKRTRGIWITTKKVDNLRVINNPLSFIPTNSNTSKEIPLHSHQIKSNVKGNDDVFSDQQCQRKKVIKTLKPIRIGKTNGFYHLASDGVFHQISPEKCSKRKRSNPVVTFEDDNDKSEKNSMNENENENKYQSESFGIFNKKVLNKPIAEIAPQLKSTTSQIPVKRKLEGMFVLKPEEINQRSFEMIIGATASEVNSNANSPDNTNYCDNTAIVNDIENFLASSAIQKPPNDEIYIISDEEGDDSSRPTYNWKFQYIICKNVKSLGWIHGRRDSKNHLSFEFPGFKQTDFYPEREAFEKINQVFSRKVYVPKNLTLEWCTVDDLSQIDERQKLQNYELNADYIMTKKGLCHKSDIIKNIKSSSRAKEPTQSDVEKCLLSASAKPEFHEMKNALLKELEETSVELEDESNILLTETLSRKDSFLDTLGELSDIARQRFSEKLQEIYSDDMLSDS